MIIASAKILISTEECTSLKAKRKILMSIKVRLKNKFNFSVAEIDYQDVYHEALLGIACVSNDAQFANKLISKAMDFIEEAFPGRLMDYQMDIETK